MSKFASDLLSKASVIHDRYSTIIGSTQPIFDRIAHSIQKISSSIWNSKPIIASKAIIGSVSQSRIIQGGLQKTIAVVTHKNPFSVQMKRHLLNQDPKIKRIKNKIHDLEDKIQCSYCKVFNKPILMDKMEFSLEEYQVIARHFQEFLAENRHSHTESFPTCSNSIEDLIEFIESDTIPDSQLLKEEIITTIESLSPTFSQSSTFPENEKILEADQAFQNCYFLFLSKELLRKFEKGEIYKDDLLVFLKNYKASPITSLINDATIENIGEVCAGMIGTMITESTLATSLHSEVNKKILGPILSISPLHRLLGSFSSYLGITLASYIGIKALGSQESLKDYIHNMTWATIASMVTEYGLEVSEISNPICTFLVPLIASSVAYNFSSLYEPLLKTEYLAQTISENYPLIIETTDEFVKEKCIALTKEQIQNTNISEIKNRINPSLDRIFDYVPFIDQNKEIINFITNNHNLDALFKQEISEMFKNLLLDSLNAELIKQISNFIVTKDSILSILSILFAEFSKFYTNLISDESLLKNFYAHRLQIIEASSKFSGNSTISAMPDMQDILRELVYAINPLQKNSLGFAFLFTKINELFPTSLFQSLSKKLEKSLQFQIYPFSTMDPLFLEIVVKSFVITTLSERKSLLKEIIYTGAFPLQNTLKLIDSLIHINLIGQNDKKQQSFIKDLTYNLIHQEINTAIQSVPELLIAKSA